MNRLPVIARAVVITVADNPLSGVPCQVYRVARPSHFPTTFTLRDGGPSGPILFKDFIGVQGGDNPSNPGVNFNPVPLDFKEGVHLDGTTSGELVLYLGPEDC